MKQIYENVLELIGNTPLIHLNQIEKEQKTACSLYAKLERTNPGGSVKDRIAKQMILDGFANGSINNETVLIEATSGNTGVGISMLGAYFGLKVIICMPETMSKERRMLMSSYGATLVLTEGKLGMAGSVQKAEEIHREYPNSIIMSQFENPSNPKAHYLTTGPEIYEALEGKIDAFVAGFGTGGTVSGVGKYLKERNPNIKIFGIEPASSPLITKGQAGPHKIQGIGANFKPGTLDLKIVDEILVVTNEEALDATRALAKKEGLLVGISSGAALCGALQVAQKGFKNIVTLFPDTGERYLSSGVFDIE